SRHRLVVAPELATRDLQGRSRRYALRGQGWSGPCGLASNYRTELVQQVVRARVALPPIPREAALKEGGVARAQVRTRYGDLWQRLPADLGDRVADGRAAERRVPREQLVQHHGERPQVAAQVDVMPARLLRAHVGWGAQEHTLRGDGAVRLRLLGDAEV